MWLALALLTALVGVLPLIIKGRLTETLALGVPGVLLLSWIYYCACPTTIWPLLGMPGLFILLMWVICALNISNEGLERGSGSQRENHNYWAFPLSGIGLLLTVSFINSEMLNASRYCRLIGSVEERKWTQDIQPKNPHHMKMGSLENAKYLAKKVLGSAGAVGSQFHVDEDHLTLQMIKGELWYVAPLDYSGFGSYCNTPGIPGYVKIHAEDPSRQAELITTQPMAYSPGSFFSYNLERVVWNHSISYGIAEIQFEIDEQEQPWWVVSLFQPTIGWSGSKICKVLLISPFTGVVSEYSLQGQSTVINSEASPATVSEVPGNQVPSFVDRVIPESYIKDYIKWWGLYQQGWWNSCWAANNLTETDDATLIYGSEGTPDWVADLTSTNSKDDSLIGVFYINSHTGKAVLYRTHGGSTSRAVLSAVNHHSDIQYKHLHGIDPQLYNVYGNMVAVVPLLNENHAYQGAAFVDILNLQNIAVGRNQFEAMAGYQKLTARAGQQVSVDATHEVNRIVGIVDRYNSEVMNGNTIYYMHLNGTPHMFSGSAVDFHKLSLTQIGDQVRVEFYASGEDIQPLHGFENRSLILEATQGQKEIWKRSEEAQQEALKKRESTDQDVDELLKKLPPEKLRQLLKLVKDSDPK